MTDRLAEIEARLSKATPGPWPEDYIFSAVRHIARNCDHIESTTDPDFCWDRYEDAPLIAAAPQDLRYLSCIAPEAIIELEGGA